MEQDKRLAKSNDGLPLGKFDSAWIADFFRAEKMQQNPSPELAFPASSGLDAEAYGEAVKQNNLALTDPAVISTVVMRVQEKPADNRFAAIGGVGKPLEIPKRLNLSSYDIVITYNLDGEDRNMEIPMYGRAFPIWSPEREAEILKGSQ